MHNILVCRTCIVKGLLEVLAKFWSKTVFYFDSPHLSIGHFYNEVNLYSSGGVLR